MKNYFVSGAILLLSTGLSSGVVLADYNTQLDFAYLSEKSSPSDIKTTGYALGATYHLDSIGTGSGPLREAGFLNPTTAINVSHFSFDIKSDISDAEISRTEIGFDFVDSSQKYSVGLEVGKNDFNLFGLDLSSDTLGLSFDYYLARRQAISFGVEMTEYGASSTEDEGLELSLGYRQLVSLGAQTALAIGAKYTKSDTDDKVGGGSDSYKSIELETTYYMDKMTGFTFGIDNVSGDALDEGQTLTIGASRYLTPNTEVTLAYNTFSAKSEADDDDKGFLITVSHRL